MHVSSASQLTTDSDIRSIDAQAVGARTLGAVKVGGEHVGAAGRQGAGEELFARPRFAPKHDGVRNGGELVELAQRFQQALRPPGMARPAWMALSALLARMDAGEAVTEAREAFAALAAEVPFFEGLDWHAVGFRGAARAGAAVGEGG